MKLAVISDTHVHPWSAFSTGSGLDNTRMARTLDVMRDAFDWARAHDGVLVHAGDWIHTTGHARHTVTSPLWDLLEAYDDVQVVTVWGNHDSRGRGTRRVVYAETVLRQLKALDNVHVLCTERFSMEIGGEYVVFAGAGAQPDPKMLDLDALGAHPSDVCVLHGMVSGASFPSGTVAKGLDPDVLLRNWPLTVVGDIHHPHVHEEDGRYILIPGSPEHHNFGDRGPHGWWTVDMERDGDGPWDISVEMHESSSPKFLTVDRASEVAEDGNFYRIRGPVDQQLPPNATAIAPGPSTVEARDALAGAHGTDQVLDRWMESNPPAKYPALHARVGRALLTGADVPVPVPCRLRRVEMLNFMSHADTSWELTDGVHMVTGRSHFYRSNGAGKSTLADAAYWCLTGKTTKGVSAADVVRWGTKQAVVMCVLDLYANGAVHELVVVRERTAHGGNLTVTVDNVPQEAETTRALESVLVGLHGMTPELTTALGYFSQEDPALLARFTDGQIKDRLADLSGARVYEEGAERARRFAKERRGAVERAGGRVDALEVELEEAVLAINEARDFAAAWEDTRGVRLEVAEEARRAVEAEDAVREATWRARYKRAGDAVDRRKVVLRERAQDVEEEVDAIQDVLAAEYSEESQRLSAVEAELDGRASTTMSVEELRTALADTEAHAKDARDRRQGLARAAREAEQRANELSVMMAAARARMEKLEHGVCPTCGQALPEDADAVEAEGETIRELTDQRVVVLAKMEEALGLIPEVADPDEADAKVAALRQILADTETLHGVLRRQVELLDKIKLVRQTAEAQARREADARLAADEKALDDRLDHVMTVLEEDLHFSNRRVAEAEGEVLRIKAETNPHAAALERDVEREQRVRRSRWSAHRARARAERDVAVGDYWADAFGKAGVQSLLMDQLAAQFNACRGRVFPVLTRGVYDVQFSTTSQTQAGEARERIEFQVYQQGARVPYANLSGGQRRRLDLGVLLTMTMAASAAYGIRGAFGVLFLDEVTSFLDDDGREALAETLAEYDVVDSVWVVSQSAEMQALFPDVLEVEQDERGVSRVVG